MTRRKTHRRKAVYEIRNVDRFHGHNPTLDDFECEIDEAGFNDAILTKDRSKMGKVLREARLLAPGESVAEIRAGEEGIVVFPKKAIHRTGTHSLTINLKRR